MIAAVAHNNLFAPSSVLCLSLSAPFASSSGEGTSKTLQSSSQALMLSQKGLTGLVMPRVCLMSGDSAALTQAWKYSLVFSLGHWLSRWSSFPRMQAERLSGCCGHYLQLGAAHGYCVQAREPERALKWGKKNILHVFLLPA